MNMKLNIETTIGGKKFSLKFGIGFLFYMAEKENMRISTLVNEISTSGWWNFKIIFHGIRYFEKCNNIESIWSNEKIWDLIDIEMSLDNCKINNIIDFFSTTFPKSYE